MQLAENCQRRPKAIHTNGPIGPLERARARGGGEGGVAVSVLDFRSEHQTLIPPLVTTQQLCWSNVERVSSGSVFAVKLQSQGP